jgi:hypothetical protein
VLDALATSNLRYGLPRELVKEGFDEGSFPYAWLTGYEHQLPLAGQGSGETCLELRQFWIAPDRKFH